MGLEAGTRKEPDENGQWSVLLPLLVCLFLLIHPYMGLVHDARIYTLQAINLLHPELFGADVYLKYGSQDAYTLFSPLYAATASALGPEHAASLITLVSSVGLLCAAWFLARALMPATLAWLAVGALIIFPGFYGPDEFFQVIEGFVTPRLPSQALVLGAVAAWLRGWRASSSALLAAGTLLHPIMAFCGIALLLVIWCMDHWRKAWPHILVLSLTASLVTAALPELLVRFDAAWWPLVARENLLLLGDWKFSDWARVTTVLTTLVFAGVVLSGATRRLAAGAVVACCAALLLSLIAGDLMKLVLVIQAQPWRILWLATALALILLPAIALACWRGSGLSRAGLLLLLAAWLIGHQGAAFLFSVPALLIIVLRNTAMSARASYLAATASGVALAVVTLCVLTVSFSENVVGRPPGGAFWKPCTAALTSNPAAPGLLLVVTWKLVTQFAGSLRRSIGALLTALLVPPVAVATSGPWMEEAYANSVRDSFASWRALIPPGTDILWATDLIPGSDPATVWLIFQRPSYYSSVQVNSALFSRAAAMELRRRHESIPAYLSTEQPVEIKFKPGQFSAVGCNDLPVRHIIADIDVIGAQVFPAPTNAPEPFDRLKLQVCPQL